MSLMILINAIQLPLVAAIFWLLADRRFRYRMAFATALAAVSVYGLFASSGAGAWVNHWFGVVLVVSGAAGVAWGRAERFWKEAGWPRRWIVALFPLFVTLGALVQEVLPRRILELPAEKTEWAAAENRFSADVEYERGRAGPAICEDLSLCAFAGKPLLYEPFAAQQRMLRDREAEASILHALQTHRYQTIQIDAPYNQPITDAKRSLFPGPFMQTLLANYHVDRQTSDRTFYVPNAQTLHSAQRLDARLH